MAIGPLQMNGIISRTQDYSTIKQNEDNRGMVNQQVFQDHFEKALDERYHQVNQGDDTAKGERRSDAREKGSNEYTGDGGQNRKKKDNPKGKVTIKGQRSFDVKI